MDARVLCHAERAESPRETQTLLTTCAFTCWRRCVALRPGKISLQTGSRNSYAESQRASEHAVSLVMVCMIYAGPPRPANCKMTPKPSKDDREVAFSMTLCWRLPVDTLMECAVVSELWLKRGEDGNGRAVEGFAAGRKHLKRRWSAICLRGVEEEEAAAAESDWQDCRQGRCGSSGTGVVVYAQIFCVFVDPLRIPDEPITMSCQARIRHVAINAVEDGLGVCEDRNLGDVFVVSVLLQGDARRQCDGKCFRLVVVGNGRQGALTRMYIGHR